MSEESSMWFEWNHLDKPERNTGCFQTGTCFSSAEVFKACDEHSKRCSLHGIRIWRKIDTLYGFSTVTGIGLEATSVYLRGLTFRCRWPLAHSFHYDLIWSRICVHVQFSSVWTTPNLEPTCSGLVTTSQHYRLKEKTGSNERSATE